MKKRWAARQLRKIQPNVNKNTQQFYHCKSEYHSQAFSEQKKRSHMVSFSYISQ